MSDEEKKEYLSSKEMLSRDMNSLFIFKGINLAGALLSISASIEGLANAIKKAEGIPAEKPAEEKPSE